MSIPNSNQTIKLFYPVKLEFTAEELPDGSWKLLYKEYCRPEDLKAFRNSAEIVKVIAAHIHSMQVELDETKNCITVTNVDTRENIFNFLCGEFFSLSGIAKKTLQDLFIQGAIGMAALAEIKKTKEETKNAEASMTEINENKLGCSTCDYDRLCSPVSRQINYDALKKLKVSTCPAWKEIGA